MVYIQSGKKLCYFVEGFAITEAILNNCRNQLMITNSFYNIVESMPIYEKFCNFVYQNCVIVENFWTLSKYSGHCQNNPLNSSIIT